MRMHTHPKPALVAESQVKRLTTDPAGKWIELGHHQVLPDKDGKIIAEIYIGAPTQPAMPIVARIGSREIGKYISAAAARKAIDRALGNCADEEDGIIHSVIERFRRKRAEADEQHKEP